MKKLFCAFVSLWLSLSENLYLPQNLTRATKLPHA